MRSAVPRRRVRGVRATTAEVLEVMTVRRSIASGILVGIVTVAGCTAVNSGGEEETSPPETATTTATRSPTSPPPETSPRAPTSPSPTNEAAPQQAAALNDLLDRSAVQRRTVATATGQIDRCANLADAQQELDQVAAERDGLVEDLGELDLSAVPGGDLLRSDLTVAWQASAASGRSYATWAEEAQVEGCPDGGPAPRTMGHDAAQSTDESATESKEAFVSRWNPVASEYGLPERSAGEI